MQVADKTVVALRYVMKDQGGLIMEDTMRGPAVEYVHGIGAILPQLEKRLTGLACGDQTSFAFEDDTAGNIHFDVIIDSIREANENELSTGKPISVLQKEQESCGPDCCCR